MDYTVAIDQLSDAILALQDQQARAELQENQTLTRLKMLENRLDALETPPKE